MSAADLIQGETSLRGRIKALEARLAITTAFVQESADHECDDSDGPCGGPAGCLRCRAEEILAQLAD